MVLPTRQTQEPRRPLPSLRGWTRKFSSFLRFQQYKSDQTPVTTVIVAKDGTGDFDKIQKAIDSLPDTGGQVVVKEGTYKETVIINKDNVELLGSGKASIISPTFIPGFGGVAVAISSSSISNARIRNLYLIGTGSGVISWTVALAGTDCEISGCWIENAGQRGIFVASVAVNCKIINNFISANAKDAILLVGTTGGNLIAQNTIFSNGNTGIVIRNSNNNEIVNNIIHDNDTGNTASFDGIRLENSSFNIISNNRCFDNDRFEINISDSNCQGNIISYNNLQGDDREGAINDDGTDTQIGGNVT